MFLIPYWLVMDISSIFPGRTMRIVTSFGPSRIERQQRCLQSWLNAGHEVIAVQSVGEPEKLSPHFLQAKFVETDLVADKFNKPAIPRIKAMIDQATDKNILIVNSDLELVGNPKDFANDWSEPPEKVLKVGIRWDYLPRTRAKRMFKWGVDAFLITPQIAQDLPDIGLAIACPAWDYFIPYHLVTRCGYTVVTNKRYHLKHDIHPRNWSDTDYHTGLRIMKEQYGIDKLSLANFIQEQTGRKHMKHWVHAK